MEILHLRQFLSIRSNRKIAGGFHGFFCGTLASLSAGQRWGVVNENRRLPIKPVWGIAKLLLSDAVEKLHEMTGSSRVKSLSGLA